MENIHFGDDPISVVVKLGEFKQVSISVHTACLISTVTLTGCAFVCAEIAEHS